MRKKGSWGNHSACDKVTKGMVATSIATRSMVTKGVVNGGMVTKAPYKAEDEEEELLGQPQRVRFVAPVLTA